MATELSLSNALLDGTIKRGAIKSHSLYEEEEEDEANSSRTPSPDSFPALIYSDPHKALDQRILFRPPSKKPTEVKGDNSEKRRRFSEIFPSHNGKEKEEKKRRFSQPHVEENKKNRDSIISQLFSKRKKQDTLTRSLSWNAIHRLHKIQEEEEEKKKKSEAPPQTFVYKMRARKFNRRFSPKESQDSASNSARSSLSKSTSCEEKEEVQEKAGEEENDTVNNYDTPSVPPRNDEITDFYEVPEPVKPVKLPRTKKVVLTTPQEAPPIKPRTKKQPAKAKRDNFFTLQDIVSPSALGGSEGGASNNNNNIQVTSEDIGLLKIKVLAVRIPQTPVNKEGGASYESDDEDIPLGPIAKVTPKDGLFCVLSINGKHSQYESSVQPLNTIRQASVWEQESESEAIFYATHSQQVFVMSRMIPLNDIPDASSNDHQPLSSRANAECVGVGILPISSLPPVLVKGDRGSIEDWTKVNTKGTEVTVPLEPHGSVLLRASYTCLQPQALVSCTGTVTVTSLCGVDCYREGEACWTCCTVDIDTENCGTTSSKIGLEDCLSEGWCTEYIEFDARASMSCRIQLWGFTSQESEYWFGEVYIPLALVLPYSRHIVHQDLVGGPLRILDNFEREITMPVEPKGHISVKFSMSPLQEEDNLNDTLKALEDTGLFKPEAIAQLKSEVEREESHKFSTIPEDDPMLVSGPYDHLTPPPTSPPPITSLPPSATSSLTALSTLTRTLNKNRMTLRLLGNIELQVPQSYDERKHKLNTEIDPYRELEIIKVELRDTKSRLASSEFYKEKAELKIKTLEEEISKLKKKQQKKIKKKK